MVLAEEELDKVVGGLTTTLIKPSVGTVLLKIPNPIASVDECASGSSGIRG